MQESIILNEETHEYLNTMLTKGWKVVFTCPMPSSCATGAKYSEAKIDPTCLVIIQKD